MGRIDVAETRMQRTGDGAADRAAIVERSAAAILSPIQENFDRQGLSHLRVRQACADNANPVLADVVDRNGTVVLSISVDRGTGLLRDVG